GSIGAPGLDVKLDLTWPPKPTWKDHDFHAPTLAFEVTLRDEPTQDVVSFRLTMPPPAAMPTAVRQRSLFVVPPGPERADGSSERVGSVYPFLSARAFDRLYDELYALFFSGDPRVPLHDEDP